VGNCIGTVKAASMFGTNRSRPLMALELVKGVDGKNEEVRQKLKDALEAANAIQPAYSHVKPAHVLVVEDGTLPVTVKGNVQRGKAEKQLATELDSLEAGDRSGLTTLLDDDEDEGYDSLALTKGSGPAKKKQYEWLHGARFLAAMWIIGVHHESLDYIEGGVKTTATLDAALSRAGVALSFFMVVSGFGCHLSNSKKNITRSFGHYVTFLIERLDRVILTMWLSLFLIYLLSPLAKDNATYTWDPSYPGGDLSEMVFCIASLNTPQAFYPSSVHCTGEAWFIGALVPSFLAYPLYQKVVKFMDRKTGTPGLLILGLVVWLAYFIPNIFALQNGTGSKYFNLANADRQSEIPPKLTTQSAQAADASQRAMQSSTVSRWMQRFVVYNMCDFFIGIIAAHLVSKSNKADKAADALVDMKKKPSMASRCVSAIISRGTLADLIVVLIGVYTFAVYIKKICLSEDFTCLNEEMQRLFDSHLLVFPICFMLWGGCKDGGSGIFASLCEQPALQSLGMYSLDAYLLGTPLMLLFLWLGFEMDYKTFSSPVVFMTYLLTLWLVSGINAELFMAPLTARMRKMGCYTAMTSPS